MSGFPPITDVAKFAAELEKDKTIIPFTELLEKNLGVPLPGYTGMVMFGEMLIFVNDAEMLEDFYVKKN